MPIEIEEGLDGITVMDSYLFIEELIQFDIFHR